MDIRQFNRSLTPSAMSTLSRLLVDAGSALLFGFSVWLCRANRRPGLDADRLAAGLIDPDDLPTLDLPTLGENR